MVNFNSMVLHGSRVPDDYVPVSQLYKTRDSVQVTESRAPGRWRRPQLGHYNIEISDLSLQTKEMLAKNR